MSTNLPMSETNSADARRARREWVKPSVTRIVAGSAEAIQRDGQPDGGDPGQARS